MTSVIGTSFQELLEEEDMIDNTCLITREILNDSHIALPCGHKFNYKPLYKTIKGRKVSNQSAVVLGINQVECPYCRIIIDGVLPKNVVEQPEERRGVNIGSKVISCYKCTFNNVCKLPAHIISSGTYCTKHAKVLEVGLCGIKLKTRPGKTCTNVIKENGRCRIHQPSTSEN